MLGTYANTITILVGTLVGCTLKKGLSEKQSAILLQAMGLAAAAIGIHSLVVNMSQTTAPVLFIVSLALGGFLGQSIDIDAKIDNLGKRFKTLGNLEGLVTATLIFCVGTLSILGPIESAINNNHTLLFTNATLDLVTSMVFAASFGRSILYAAPILFCWQGAIYLGASFLAPFLTPELMSEIGIVGGILILCTGLNILKTLEVKTLNFLPALLVPPLYFIVMSFLL